MIEFSFASAHTVSHPLIPLSLCLLSCVPSNGNAHLRQDLIHACEREPDHGIHRISFPLHPDILRPPLLAISGSVGASQNPRGYVAKVASESSNPVAMIFGAREMIADPGYTTYSPSSSSSPRAARIEHVTDGALVYLISIDELNPPRHRFGCSAHEFG